ncbi:NUDIX domain-containing protein [Roseibium sp. MMSF_3544]|uniref:NUDIX domain-containing protein n=1 Tax=unclassified Roseibium TaxID=2629323 RepID=UPI00273DF6D7|nr:NUDIX domain-containing protein [Roseibium sp. MMSF_3544]
MELLMLCAGAAMKSWNGPDIDRPLRNKGKRQAQKIGTWMAGNGLKPDMTITTSALRAQVTAEKALKAAGWTARNITLSAELSDGHVPELPKEGRPLLVGLAGQLREVLRKMGLDADPGPGVFLWLSQENGDTRLVKRVDPKDLPDLFPYPTPNGSDQRERPAYYYTQSSVVPFRRTGGGTEILIVGSSGGSRWVVPKGIVEPGLGPAASAMNEALEEAGVKGTVGTAPLGTYAYEKWGATCEVTVYSMEVTEILPDDAWEEKHRTRRWVSPEDAASLLHQTALKALVTKV